MKFELALEQSRARIALRCPHPAVPDFDVTGAIMPSRNGACEFSVLQRMVLHMYGETPLGRIEARAFGNGPARQNTADLKSEIIVQLSRGMLLHDEAQLFSALLNLAARFRRGVKITFAAVFFKSHGEQCQ